LFLFVFESIGTPELLFIGIIALVFLGPRKLPEIARKMGKLMTEFRGTANEFKETWQREVDLEQEVKAFDVSDLTADDPIPRTNSATTTAAEPAAPAIKEIDPAKFDEIAASAAEADAVTEQAESAKPDDKRNWL